MDVGDSKQHTGETPVPPSQSHTRSQVMSDSFVPRDDANALIWMQAFSSGISSSSATYQLSASDAITIANAVQAFSDALALAEAPLTRTPGNVNAKDVARNAAESLCRQYALAIKVNNGISDQSKIDIGVRPPSTTREPIFCPQTSPLLNVAAATPGSHMVTYADSMDPNKKAKPFGAAALQLFVAIKDTATENVDEAKFLGLFTTTPVETEFTEADDGKCATYFARWSGKRGDVGPWSLPISMRIAA
jgi:hypothetical protein